MDTPTPKVGGAAARYVNRVFGGIFKPVQNQVNVGVAPVLVRNTNPNAVVLVITNTGTTNITLTSAPGTVSGQGILLLGNGASMELNVEQDGELVTFPWYAVSDLAGGSVNVFESEETVRPSSQGG